MSQDPVISAGISTKLKEVGLWMRETIIITMNDIVEAVMEDLPDDLPTPSNEPSKVCPEYNASHIFNYNHCKCLVHSSSDTGATQSCDLSELAVPDDFPNTINRVSLITRINELYSTGLALSGSISRENFKLTPSMNEDEIDHVLVSDLPDDDSDWVKL